MKKSILCAVGDALYEAIVFLKSKNDVERVVLNCSELDGKWTQKALATPPVSIEDNGNGIQVQFDDGKSIYLDYSQVVELRAILNVEDSFNRLGPTRFKKWSSK